MAVNNKSIKKILKNLLLGILLFTFTFGQLGTTSYALSSEQKRVIDSGVYYFNTAVGSSDDCAAGSLLPGKNNQEKVWNFLVAKLELSNVQAAGVMGNIDQESNFDPTARNPSSGAYGIVQWYAGRETALINYARSQGKSVSNLAVQLEFLKIELEGDYKSAVLDPIKRSNSLEEATLIWLERFEVPCLPGQCGHEMAIRMPLARSYLAKYGSGTSGDANQSFSECAGSASASNVVKVAKREYQENKGILEYGGDIMEYTDGRQEAWCADFISWVYKDAGSPFKDGLGRGGWQHPSVLELQSWFRSKHTYFEVGEQRPKPGDVAFYIGGQTPDGGSTQHVNIVISVDGNKMTTIGGNESDQVKRGTRIIALGSSSLVGFGRLKQ